MIEYICIKCHGVGKPRRKKRGSGKLEFTAWLMFPFGLPYTLWRMLSKRNVCRFCGESFLTPVDSPAGVRLLNIVAGETGVKTAALVEDNPLPIEEPEQKTRAPRPPEENIW